MNFKVLAFSQKKLLFFCQNYRFGTESKKLVVLVGPSRAECTATERPNPDEVTQSDPVDQSDLRLVGTYQRPVEESNVQVNRFHIDKCQL